LFAVESVINHISNFGERRKREKASGKTLL